MWLLTVQRYLKSEAEYNQKTIKEEIDKLEYFFSLIDSSKLFEHTDPAFFIRLRNETWDALVKVLFWGRPLLEFLRGFDWPYNALKKRVRNIEYFAQKGEDPFIKMQARLFLTLLPFPGQWKWLIKAERKPSYNDEIDRFLTLEQQKIQAKIDGKRQKQFKLRHFCQILKKPRMPPEKGVLRIFSIPYFFSINSELLKELSRRYFLYVEPSAGIIFRHTWWRSFSKLKDPCLFGVSSEEDAAFIQSQPGTLTTHLAHGDFLENKVEVDGSKDKDFDIVFNATFDEVPRKRHQFLLKLMKHPLLHHTKVLSLGLGKEENVEKFRQQIHQEGLADRATVMFNLRRIDVPKILDRCRMGVHLALHENGCRCIYEFFRSDLPCVISSSTAGVNMEIFNPRTGLAVPDKDLPETISHVLINRKDYDPRGWFLEHSGSYHSTNRLNEQLKGIFQSLGYEWSDDIVPLGSSGANRYIDSSHYARFRYEFEKLLECFQNFSHSPIDLSLD